MSPLEDYNKGINIMDWHKGMIGILGAVVKESKGKENIGKI